MTNIDLKGYTVIGLRTMDESEMILRGWGHLAGYGAFTPQVLDLRSPDGLTVVTVSPSADDEGNGPGVLWFDAQEQEQPRDDHDNPPLRDDPMEFER